MFVKLAGIAELYLKILFKFVSMVTRQNLRLVMRSITLPTDPDLVLIMHQEDKGYHPFRTLMSGGSQSFIVLGSTKLGTLELLLQGAQDQAKTLIHSGNGSEITNCLREASTKRNLRLNYVHDIFYLLPAPDPVPAGWTRLIPQYSRDMQLAFTLGLLFSQRGILFCSNPLYSLNINGGAIIGGNQFGKTVQEDNVDAILVGQLRARCGVRDPKDRVNVYIGGTALEFYFLKVHGYEFSISHDGKLLTCQPDTTKPFYFKKDAFSLVRRLLEKTHCTKREEISDKNIVKSALIEIVDEVYNRARFDPLSIAGISGFLANLPMPSAPSVLASGP